MLFYYPSYFNDFRCLASGCHDTCCAQWEINVDEETYCKYESLKDPFAESIRNKIMLNSDGEKCFSLSDKKCPFLNHQKLCDIHIAYGEDFTPAVCRQHPCFIEEYDGFTEVSLSLSCPGAVSLIICDSANHGTYSEPVYTGNNEVLHKLIESRSKILCSEDIDFIRLQNIILDTAADDLLDIDLCYVQEHSVIDVQLLKKFLHILKNKCVILTDEWSQYIETSEFFEITESELNDYILKINDSIFDVCRYFVYRYYLKAVNDIDIYSVALFIIISCRICAFISLACDKSFIEICRLYSKEIEHSTDNTDLLISYLDDI